MSQLALPHYKANTKEETKIRDKIHRNTKKYGIKYKIWRRVDFDILYCCECKKTYPKEEFKKRGKLQQISSYCYRCEWVRCRNWEQKNPQKVKISRQKSLRSVRKKTLTKINPELKCVRCGCSDIRFLEINHINGGGKKEYKKIGGRLAHNIYRGIRKTDDLELLCRPCNHIHFLEMKYKEQIPLKTVFINNDWEREL